MDTELQPHPIADLVPQMQAWEFEALRADIMHTGRARDPVVLFEGRILDGRNRYRICREAGLDFTTREFDPQHEGDPVAFVRSATTHRNLNQSQRAMMLVDMELYGREREAARERMKEAAGGGRPPKKTLASKDARVSGPSTKGKGSAGMTKGKTAEIVAREDGLGVATVERTLRLKRDGTPALANAVRQGVMRVTEALQYIDLPVSTQRRIAGAASQKERTRMALEGQSRSRANSKKGREMKQPVEPVFAELFLGMLCRIAGDLAHRYNVRTPQDIASHYLDTFNAEDPITVQHLRAARDVIRGIAAVHEVLSAREEGRAIPGTEHTGSR